MQEKLFVKKESRKRLIPFSIPDIGESEIAEVAEALRSGWITTGPRTKLLERQLAAYINIGLIGTDTESDEEVWCNRVVCLNSATAAEELNLRILGIGPGDEVIVPAYTYTASASAAIHCGATIVFVDAKRDKDASGRILEMDYDKLEAAITERTKAVVSVDLGGIVCDYDRIFEITEKKRALYHPVESDGTLLSDFFSHLQHGIGRVAVLADGAHSLGASRIVSCTGQGRISPQKKYCGQIAHFTSYSFHAVKNFTTAEGGASTWCLPESVYENGVTDAKIYHMYQLLSLHGQDKDALEKAKMGAWEYDIIGPWYKCNMTDVAAAIGLAQLKRYPEILKRRKEIIERYDVAFLPFGIEPLSHYTDKWQSAGHLYITRVPGITSEQRQEIITGLAERGVTANVHYKPLPMMTAYKNMGFDIKNYPNSYDKYINEISLPLHTKLTDEDVEYIIDAYMDVLKERGYKNCM